MATKCSIKNAASKTISKQPGFVIIDDHYFILFGISKDRKSFVLQSFCNDRISFEVMKDVEEPGKNASTYFVSERFKMTNKCYDELEFGCGNDVSPEEFF